MAMVTSSTGPINSVLHRLPTGLVEFSGLRKALAGIKEQMLGFSAPGVLTSTLARRWVRQLREIAYDVDRWLDERLIDSRGQFQSPQSCSPDDLAQIQYFELLIAEAHDRSKMFGVNLEPRMLTTDDPEHEKPCRVQFEDDGFSRRQMPCLVGLSGSENELVQHLMDDLQELKVVAVLGPGGLGKTTLAREVFKKQQVRFDCTAFVCVGWNPSRDAVLTNIAHQVMPKTTLHHDEKNIASRLYEFLGTKRYLIVVDDVWSVLDWTAIACALPHNNLGSRIIATTEMNDVASSCCRKPIDSLLLLNPLNDADSRNLVLSQISCLEADCIPDLKIFGGNPLLLRIAAGLLAVKSPILSEFKIPENGMPMMKRILDLSYADLPLNMKSCFLYLGVFPQNNIIKKDRLIRMWIAEGFLQISQEESLTEVSERYVGELARRGLIQLVFEESEEQLIGITVHAVIHDFILSLSSEENFFTTGEELYSGSCPCVKVRRFAHDCTRQIDSSTLASSAPYLAGVRSLTVSGDTNGKLRLSQFKMIRVLDLEDAKGLRCNQLKSIGYMLFLRYLGLKGSDVTMLPQEVEALEHLTTLDIRKTSVKYLPELRTRRLVSLLADGVVISRKMEKMNELDELGTIIVNMKYPLDSLTKLVESSKLLRVLGVRLDYCDRQGLMHFLDVIEKCNLQTLYIAGCSDLLLGCWGHRRLQLLKFSLKIRYQRVTSKMICLKDVTHLDIKTGKIEVDDLNILASLPNLRVLWLDSCLVPRRCVLRNHELEDGFRCLREFRFKYVYGMTDLTFGPNVMPQLRRLCLILGVDETANSISEFGIQHLTGLLQVGIHIKCFGPLSFDVEDAKRRIRDQVSLLPNHPLLKVEISHPKEKKLKI